MQGHARLGGVPGRSELGRTTMPSQVLQPVWCLPGRSLAAAPRTGASRCPTAVQAIPRSAEGAAFEQTGESLRQRGSPHPQGRQRPWESGEVHSGGLDRSPQQAWGRRMQPGPAKSRQPQSGQQAGPQGRQRGPVQPAVWIDRAPGSPQEDTRTALQQTSIPADEYDSAKEQVKQQQGSFRSTLRAQSNGAGPSGATLPHNNRSVKAPPEGTAARSRLSRGGVNGTAARAETFLDDGQSDAAEGSGRYRGTAAFEAEQPQSSGRSTGLGGNAATPGSQRRRRGLWGRPPSNTGSGQDTEQQQWEGWWGRGASEQTQDTGTTISIVDDWVENELPMQEADDDGWGSTYASTKPPPVIFPAAESISSSAEDARPAEDSASVPEGREKYDSQEPEILDDPDDWESNEMEWEEGEGPDITLLAPSETDELLPIVPTAEQMGASWGSAVEVWQRLGAAAFLTLITAKFNMVLIASGSATYPFWGPILGAANRNRTLRQSGRHVGFWRTSVLEVLVERPQRQRYTSRRSAGQPDVSRPTVRFLLGDESGARSQLSLPFNRRYEQIQVGEPAEVLVLSAQTRFDSFKALKEVYLPVSGLWLSDYPHVNRNLFLDISLDIERERKKEMMEGAYETAL